MTDIDGCGNSMNCNHANTIRNIYTVDSDFTPSDKYISSSSPSVLKAFKQQEQHVPDSGNSEKKLETVSCVTVPANAHDICSQEVIGRKRDRGETEECNGDEIVQNRQQETRKKAPLAFFALIFLTTIVFFSLLCCHFGPMELTFIDAFYMQFVTFSTIGFGDLVPVHKKFSDSVEKAISPFWSVYDMVYILFGMSAVSVVISCATQSDRIGRAMKWLCWGLSTQCHDHPPFRPARDRPDAPGTSNGI